MYENDYEIGARPEEEKGGNGFLDFSKIKNVEFLKTDFGKTYCVDILPYEITTNKHPIVAQRTGAKKIGSKDYVLTVWVHRKVGVDKKKNIVCLNKNFEEACPLCEKGHTPKNRAVYVVRHNGKVKIFEASYHNFEKKLVRARNNILTKRGFTSIVNPEKGCLVEFNVIEAKYQGASYPDYDYFDFVRREDPYTMEWALKNTYPLDAMLKKLSYNEIEELVYPGGRGEFVDDFPDENICKFNNNFGNDFCGKLQCEECEKETPKNYKNCSDKHEMLGIPY